MVVLRRDFILKSRPTNHTSFSVIRDLTCVGTRIRNGIEMRVQRHGPPSRSHGAEGSGAVGCGGRDDPESGGQDRDEQVSLAWPQAMAAFVSRQENIELKSTNM